MDRETDVLVLGAGLAGLRAAWAALEARPGRRVLVVSPDSGPSGSSFRNRNARLGFMAPRSDTECELFVRRALELAAPGLIRPELVRLLATEAAARLEDLASLGAPLQTAENGDRVLHPGCYARDLKAAAVLTDLPRTFELLSGRVRALGGEFLTGHLAVEILIHPDHGVCGCLLLPAAGGAPIAIRAGAVVAALGGPAPLFSPTLAGPGSGISYALLARAGAELANAGFMQFLWSRRDTLEFVRIAQLAHPEAAVVAPNGERITLPPELMGLARSRATHCPVSWGLADAALDRFALGQAGPDGWVTLAFPGQTPFQAAPLAHSGNGGALIDEHGASTVPGLFAAGECATGMHGADRIGGGQVAATQVFGTRAGGAAAGLAQERTPLPGKLFTDLMKTASSRFALPAADVMKTTPILGCSVVLAMLLNGNQHADIILNTFINQTETTLSPLALMRQEAALTVARSLHRIV